MVHMHVYRISSKNSAQNFLTEILRLNYKMATGRPKVPNNWICRLSMSCQVDTQAHSVAPTFTQCQVEANLRSVCRHLCLSWLLPMRGYHVYKVLLGSHKFVRHLLSSTRWGTNMTGMPWLFTKMKNRESSLPLAQTGFSPHPPRASVQG